MVSQLPLFDEEALALDLRDDPHSLGVFSEPESFFEEPPVDLDDEECFGEIPERIDPQTGFVED